MSTPLRIGAGPRGLTLPIEAVTETFAILAKRRAGKSNAAVVLAEEMYRANLPWVAIDPKGDWWGVRADGGGGVTGLEVLVFGGNHGDVPLEPTSGNLVADLIAERGITCVLDVSEMTKADQRRFLTDFATRLYRKNTTPLHVFCEEADEYIPQRVMGENAKMVGAFETLVKRGGFRGIGTTLITQRSASLNKDVLTQVETLIALRTTSPQDRKAILGWIEHHDIGKEVVADLPTLKDGEGWIFSPAWLEILQKIQFRRRRTFDSGATPKVGAKPRPAVGLREVDVDSIRDAMAETIQRAEADDPRLLKKRIRELEKELEEARATTPEPTEVEVPVLPEGVAEQLHALASQIVTAVENARPVFSKSKPTPRERLLLEERPKVPTPVRTPPPPTGPPNTSAGVIKLGKTERKILTVLVQHGPRTNDQLALLSGYSRKASTISVSLGKLRRDGLVEQGQPIRATSLGVETMEAIGFEPLPKGAALLEFWRNHFGLTERNVLDAFVQLYPHDADQETVAGMTGYSPTASTISVALGRLRRVGVIEGWSLSPDFAAEVGL